MTTDSHVTTLLGPYVLGHVTTGERTLVERHLAQCEHCLDEYEYVALARTYLSMLTADDVREMLSEADRQPIRAATAIGPSTSAGRPVRRRVAMVAASVALLAGIGAGTWLRMVTFSLPVDPGQRTDLVATAGNSGTGMSAVVTVTPSKVDISIDVTVRGLRPSTVYQFFLVTRASETIVVTEWRATAETQALSGSVRIPVSDVGFFAIGTPDGVISLSVPFGHGGSSRPPPSPR